ncbi:Protein kinase-like domain [Pseudocohnilembus persalinus]|uniref:Protein kinase-like domain n=1 Tax=Pseudocohnilembus persalinus TaxID=266149 RepID=A0A0V0QWY9_PSEPJ|nr:Protein kinase-like domain [Pseudocohnilembus persalinus]|eukprot:KRX06754.1 Protein kinase-like domain [Pseudocohnilembus persalinus]
MSKKIKGIYLRQRQRQDEQGKKQPAFIYFECEDIYKMNDMRNLLRRNLYQKNFEQLYKIVDKIGQGASATVYQVKSRETGENFATKMFDRQVLLKEGINTIKALQNEIEIMRQLSGHRNILELFETFETNQHYYIVTKVLSGGSLEQLIRKKKQLTLQNIQYIIKQILQGLDYMHSKGIMHRDIKPDNILFKRNDSSFDLVIADLGFSQSLDINQEALYIKCGTPGFVAPEIWQSNDIALSYNEKCDIFSLGVIAYILLLGYNPFYSKNIRELIQKNESGFIDFEQDIFQKLPKYAKNFLQKCLEINPLNRLNSNDALEHPFLNRQQEARKMKKNGQLKKEKIFISQENQIKKNSLNNDNIKLNKNNIKNNRESLHIAPSLNQSTKGYQFVKDRKQSLTDIEEKVENKLGIVLNKKKSWQTRGSQIQYTSIGSIQVRSPQFKDNLSQNKNVQISLKKNKSPVNFNAAVEQLKNKQEEQKKQLKDNDLSIKLNQFEQKQKLDGTCKNGENISEYSDQSSGQQMDRVQLKRKGTSKNKIKLKIIGQENEESSKNFQINKDENKEYDVVEPKFPLNPYQQNILKMKSIRKTLIMQNFKVPATPLIIEPNQFFQFNTEESSQHNNFSVLQKSRYQSLNQNEENSNSYCNQNQSINNSQANSPHNSYLQNTCAMKTVKKLSNHTSTNSQFPTTLPYSQTGNISPIKQRKVQPYNTIGSPSHYESKNQSSLYLQEQNNRTSQTLSSFRINYNNNNFKSENQNMDNNNINNNNLKNSQQNRKVSEDVLIKPGPVNLQVYNILYSQKHSKNNQSNKQYSKDRISNQINYSQGLGTQQKKLQQEQYQKQQQLQEMMDTPPAPNDKNILNNFQDLFQSFDSSQQQITPKQIQEIQIQQQNQLQQQQQQQFNYNQKQRKSSLFCEVIQDQRKRKSNEQLLNEQQQNNLTKIKEEYVEQEDDEVESEQKKYFNDNKIINIKNEQYNNQAQNNIQQFNKQNIENQLLKSVLLKEQMENLQNNKVENQELLQLNQNNDGNISSQIINQINQQQKQVEEQVQVQQQEEFQQNQQEGMDNLESYSQVFDKNQENRVIKLKQKEDQQQIYITSEEDDDEIQKNLKEKQKNNVYNIVINNKIKKSYDTQNFTRKLNLDENKVQKLNESNLQKEEKEIADIKIHGNLEQKFINEQKKQGLEYQVINYQKVQNNLIQSQDDINDNSKQNLRLQQNGQKFIQSKNHSIKQNMLHNDQTNSECRISNSSKKSSRQFDLSPDQDSEKQNKQLIQDVQVESNNQQINQYQQNFQNKNFYQNQKQINMVQKKLDKIASPSEQNVIVFSNNTNENCVENEEINSQQNIDFNNQQFNFESNNLILNGKIWGQNSQNIKAIQNVENSKKNCKTNDIRNSRNKIISITPKEGTKMIQIMNNRTFDQNGFTQAINQTKGQQEQNIIENQKNININLHKHIEDYYSSHLDTFEETKIINQKEKNHLQQQLNQLKSKNDKIQSKQIQKILQQNQSQFIINSQKQQDITSKVFSKNYEANQQNLSKEIQSPYLDDSLKVSNYTNENNSINNSNKNKQEISDFKTVKQSKYFVDAQNAKQKCRFYFNSIMIQDLNIGKQLISTKEEIKALRKKLDEMSQFPQNSNNLSNKKKLKNGVEQLDQENLINRLQYLVDKFDDSLQNKVDNLKAHRISKPPQILPPELRKNPFADMVPITDVEIEQKGLLNLLNTGKLPKDVDIFPAFETGAPQLDVRDIEVLEYDVKQYEEVQDNFALHHIMFRKFKLVEETPEFESFKRSYKHCFSAIFHYLKQIEKVAKAYELGLFYVDGKKIVAVSKQEEKVTLDHLVDCIVNKENLKNYWKIPGRKYNGEQGKLRAILKIQSTIRMFLGRKQFEKYLSFYRKVKKIQNCAKIYLGFKRTKKRIQQKNEQIYQQFQELQARFKEEWGIIQNKQRIEVHINSFSFDEIKRITMQKQMQRENLQISRIFRLRDPLLTIIYICPFEISQEITEYYYKILELGNVADFRSRLYFITPQNLSAFPSYFSLSKKLLYSPKSLKRIKSLIKNKTCYLFPGYPSNDDIKLCGCLNMPSLSTDPQIHLSISQKSQSRRIFEKIGVPTATGAIEIYEIEELINTLTILLVSHPKVETWVFKIDNEFAGRGIAYLNVDSIKGFTEIVSTMKEENKDAIILNIKQKIGNQLSYKLKLAMPNLFRGFKDYIAQFCKNGGVIEAMPAGGFFQINKLQFPSVSLFIEPNGNCQITNSYDKINGAPFINIGCNFPHKSGKWQQLQKYSKKVGEELYSKGIIGCVSIDFVMFKNPQNNEEEFIQGLGIDCYLNNYNSSFIYFDFQMQGKYEVHQNIYRCKLEDGEISQRNYTYCPFLLHEGLDKLNMKSFFQSCRREGIEYDLVKKIGSTFMLIDMIQSGVLSLMCINDDFQQQIDEVNKAVKFIFNNGGKLLKQNQVIGESNQDQIHLLDIQSKFFLISEKLSQQNQMNRKKDNIKLKNNQDNKYNNEQSINDGNSYQNNNKNSIRIFEEDQNGINTFNSISSSNNNNNSMIGGNSSKVRKYQHKRLILQ